MYLKPLILAIAYNLQKELKLPRKLKKEIKKIERSPMSFRKTNTEESFIHTFKGKAGATAKRLVKESFDLTVDGMKRALALRKAETIQRKLTALGEEIENEKS